ncbi:hypothetical protein F2Q68_00038569 [Brassica cretica]|uniref:Uncharacterized protein n=1 Tax=Brassica cretica TaxID=69181 RepID=A0A8S9MI42_BRACR|nr:hypothetical protein F2Q68_00038569 [Brassica cretica]
MERCHEQTSLLDEFSHGDHNNDQLLLVLDYADEILHTITFKTSSSSGLSRELSLEKKIRSRDAETFPLHGSSASSEMRTTLVNEGYSSQSGPDETEDELEPAEESMLELKPAEVIVDELDELSELSDTSLELNELSDTEDGAGLVAGRNEPFSAQRKIHNKFNLGRFYTKFDQTFPQSISSPFSSRMARGSQQGSLGPHSSLDFYNLTLLCFLVRLSPSKQPLIRWTCASYQATFRNPSFGGLGVSVPLNRKQLLQFFKTKPESLLPGSDPRSQQIAPEIRRYLGKSHPKLPEHLEKKARKRK